MVFPYKRYSDGIQRPVIQLTLRYGDREFDYEGLVDSGADMCMFGMEVALFLGIDLAKCEKGVVAGVGAVPFTYYLKTIQVEVAGRSFFIDVGFLSNVSQFMYGVIGRKNFFNQFIVTFDEVEKTLSLSKKERPRKDETLKGDFFRW
ncbi:hypothetical protein HZA87_00240 [Candidatus Uhrbacteria bacterium]|nr:hypothetical protein [Candidatus Uhrbacteria bacterium]